MVPVRPLATIPVEAGPEEIHGICRTVRALSENAPVYISHGDLAGLPAVAAGAVGVGTGWDQRQRGCAFASYAAREPGEGGGGGWYERVTLAPLLGSLKPSESEVLSRQDPPLMRILGEVPPPGPREAFDNHLERLGALVDEISESTDYQQRFETLARLYGTAERIWPRVVTHTGSPRTLRIGSRRLKKAFPAMAKMKDGSPRPESCDCVLGRPKAAGLGIGPCRRLEHPLAIDHQASTVSLHLIA